MHTFEFLPDVRLLQYKEWAVFGETEECQAMDNRGTQEELHNLRGDVGLKNYASIYSPHFPTTAFNVGQRENKTKLKITMQFHQTDLRLFKVLLPGFETRALLFLF